MIRTLRNASAAGAVLFMGAVLAGNASAAPPHKKGAAAAAPAPTVPPTATADLRSGDATKIRGALDDIRMAGKPAGAKLAPVIIELLKKGMPVSLTEAAIDTLGDLETGAASGVIVDYLHHRDPKIRQAAAKALLKTKGGAPVVKALRAALSDPDPQVRGVAATGLGELRAKDAVPDLFLALAHRVYESAASIGALCDAAQCETFASNLGKYPLDVMLGGIDPILFRPDVTDDTKIKMVGHVRELGTQEANKFLRDVLKRWKGSARIKQSLQQAVQATGGGA